jgi:ATP-dependent helicase/DNAse subunit B
VEEQPIIESKPLSASRIKVLEDCSWIYYCKYHLNLPDPSNVGAKMGSICHLIFEMLINPRHRKNYDKIVKNKSIDGDKAIVRLVKKHMAKENLQPEFYLQIDQMILVGLKADFFVKGKKGEKSELLGAEFEFNIKNEEPKYFIKGFMDKPYKVGKRSVIVDYKSSKSKFEGEDKESNIQGLMYSLASKKTWPDLDPEIQFVFLRFNDDPTVKVKFNENTLKGFEEYLAYVQKRVDNFSEEDARKNFAFDQEGKEGFKGKLMCGFAKTKGEKKKDGTPKWSCPFKFSFKYFVLKNKDGKTIKSSFENDFKPEEGEKVLELFYTGCPKHRAPIDEF